jgi:hypothetical protein
MELAVHRITVIEEAKGPFIFHHRHLFPPRALSCAAHERPRRRSTWALARNAGPNCWHSMPAQHVLTDVVMTRTHHGDTGVLASELIPFLLKNL